MNAAAEIAKCEARIAEAKLRAAAVKERAMRDYLAKCSRDRRRAVRAMSRACRRTTPLDYAVTVLLAIAAAASMSWLLKVMFSR